VANMQLSSKIILFIFHSSILNIDRSVTLSKSIVTSGAEVTKIVHVSSPSKTKNK